MCIASVQLLGALSSGLASLVLLAVEAPTCVRTDWEQLVGEQARVTDEPVSVVLQFHSLVENWDGYCTPFSARTHLAVRAWSDTQRPWHRSEYEAPAVQVYVRRGGLAEKRLLAAAAHDRFVVTGHVRALFLGRPWIEVVSACPTREQVPLGSILHASRALKLLGRGAHDLAREQLHRALDAPLPRHARLALQKILQRV